MINVLIIDDEQHAIDVLKNQLKYFKDYKICGSAQTVTDAIKLTKLLEPDLVFLDVEINTETGFDYLNAFMPEINFDIIFTTAYDNYAVRAFEYSAMHYLLKPIDIDLLKESLLRSKAKRAKEDHLERLQSLEHNIETSNDDKWIHLTTTEKRYKINTKNILYIESESNYSYFHLKDETKILTSKTLKYYTKLLEDSHFYKAHKSFLVNTNCIKSYDKKRGNLIMDNATVISVAVRRRKDFVNRFFS